MKRSSVWIGLFFILFVSAYISRAQCGNFFKTDYRAVNKIYNVNNGAFQLDDWTGDGRSDFWNFQPNNSTGTNNIIVYPSRASGYWDWDNPVILMTTLPSGLGTSSASLIVKDFNGDGLADLWAEFLGSVTIHRNTGSGALAAQTTFFYPAQFQANLGYYDMNGDGLLDWVNMVSTQTSQGSSVAYQPGQADGTFGARVDILTDPFVAGSAKAVGDFNGDGKIDVAFGTANFNNFAYLLAKNVDGVNFSVGSLTNVSATGRFQIVKDFNNDGRMDVLVKSDNTETLPRRLFILYGQSSDTFTAAEYATANSSASAQLTIAEFNGDNQPDILEAGQKFYSIYQNEGGGNFTRSDYQRHLVNGKFEDFSGDGKADLYYSDTAYPTRNMFNEQVVVIKENVCEPFGETRRANFAVDGVGDLDIWNPANGNWRALSPDLGFFANNATLTTANWGSGALGDIPAPGDYDGDGVTDRTIYRGSTGEWWSLLSSNGAWSVIRFGLSGDIPVPNDYDGGGKTDLAVYRPSEGLWYIWSTETQTAGAARFGIDGDKPVPADFDGDGKTDIAVWRPSTGVWYILRSTDFGYSAANWGISTDVPVPVDFDGDGKADLAVFRNGDWYIFRSLNNSFNFIHYGQTGDLPMPLYQNGEFAEIIVYRPVSLTWFNARTQLFALSIGFGQVGATPIYFGLPNN